MSGDIRYQRTRLQKVDPGSQEVTVIYPITRADSVLVEQGSRSITEELSLKADITSPTFLGTPKAPTAAPGNVSAQIATTGFVSTAVTNALTNYYTKAATDAKISETIAEYGTVKMEVVQELPITGAANVIYLVPKSDNPETNIYDEYIWLTSSSTYELIGNTALDLVGDFVSTQQTQSFTAAEQARARSNIGATAPEIYVGSSYPTDNIPIWVNFNEEVLIPEEKYHVSVDSTNILIACAGHHDYEYRYTATSGISSLGITFDENQIIEDTYKMRIVFKAGSQAPTFSITNNTSYTIKLIGDDCSSYTFIPVANKQYNLQFWFDGITINGLVRAI